jgi:hypothetical protein
MVIKTTLDDYDRHRWTHLLTTARIDDTIPKRKLAYIERSKAKAGGFIGTSFIGIFILWLVIRYTILVEVDMVHQRHLDF